MPDYCLRSAAASDQQSLRPLWRQSFGDSDLFIRCYEEQLFHPNWVELARLSNETVSMLTVVPTVLCTARGERVPGGYIYGVATLPEHRNRGLASRLLHQAADRRLGHGMSFLSLVPDTPELLGYYRRTIGFQPVFSCRELQSASSRFSKCGTLCPEVVDQGTYRTIREHWLAGRTHIDWNQEAIAFQGEICRQGGGNLYSFSSQYPGCAAAQYTEEGDLLVNELLAAEEDFPGCLAGLLSQMPAQRMVVRMPGWMGSSLGGVIQPFACITGLGQSVQEGYLGLDLA